MKVIVYILIFQFSMGALMPKTDFNQLSHISFLIDHYQVHKQEAKLKSQDFDVWDFVYIHYISPDEHVHDFPVDHEELPLKNLSSSTLIFVDHTIEELIFESKAIITQDFHFSKLYNRLLSPFQLRPPNIS